MINIVMYRPQMPGNVGNIIRLCANFACNLHLIGPLDYALDDRALLKAGIDYHALTYKVYHTSFDAFMHKQQPKRLIAATTKGAKRPDKFVFCKDDYLLFGRETSGLPDEIMDLIKPDMRIKIPMATNSRCINVSNSVAILTYEAFRQFDFEGLI